MSADGSINASNESPMSTRPPSPEQPMREERAQVIRDTYPILTDQEIQRILGPDRSQLSLLAQIRGGALSPRSARNISQGENMHLKVLHSIIDAMAETAMRPDSRHAVEKWQSITGVSWQRLADTGLWMSSTSTSVARSTSSNRSSKPPTSNEASARADSRRPKLTVKSATCDWGKRGPERSKIVSEETLST